MFLLVSEIVKSLSRMDTMQHAFYVVPFFLCIICSLFTSVFAVVDPGIETLTGEFMRPNSHNYLIKHLYKGTTIRAQFDCGSSSENTAFTVSWKVLESDCVRYFYNYENYDDFPMFCSNKAVANFVAIEGNEVSCNMNGVSNLLSLKNVTAPLYPSCENYNAEAVADKKFTRKPILATAWKTGNYLLQFNTTSDSVNLTLYFYNPPHGGYLSVFNWPLLPFWAVMCSYYTVLGLVWMFLCLYHYKDLLRLQMLTSVVILLGFIESAVFLAEVDSVHRNGIVSRNMLIFGAIVANIKKALARMIILIVCLGYGIVKPRLGDIMFKVSFLCGLYFAFSCIFDVLHITRDNFDKTKSNLQFPLALVEAIILFWIGNALYGTLRTLALRRNVAKHAVYRQFAVVLLMCIMAALVFLAWSVYVERVAECANAEVHWLVTDACWPTLFTVILTVICYLFSPLRNAQRFAYSPLLDEPTSDDDEETDLSVFDRRATGNADKINSDTKLRKVAVEEAKRPLIGGSGEEEGGGADKKKARTTAFDSDEDDDLRWVEANVPTAAEMLKTAVDSEDEREMREKLSKMT